MPTTTTNRIIEEIRELVGDSCGKASDNLRWLHEQMHPYFFSALQQEKRALATLATTLHILSKNRRLTLADRDKGLILACLNTHGSLYDTLRTLPEKEISLAYFAHSRSPLPDLPHELEVQRFEFDRKSNRDILEAADPDIPSRIRREISRALKLDYPDFNHGNLGRLLKIIWFNNENYVRVSTPKRLAQIIWLYAQGNSAGGLYLDIEKTDRAGESRVLFAVGNPPQKDFLMQTMEVFNRLEIGVCRAHCLTITNGIHPYFLGTFFIKPHDGSLLEKDSDLFRLMQKELCTTQILATHSYLYREFVTRHIMDGEDASLINAFTAFCYTNLSHNQPDRFGPEDVMGAFHSHPDIALQLVELFRARFDPELHNEDDAYQQVLEKTRRAIEGYNTGHRYLDEIRRAIFRCAFIFIRHTLKTNFFVLTKQSLAFRLDSAYLEELGLEFTADLPSALPFRVTFFFGRFGNGYHIGFSDIARGGWRTIIAKSRDDYTMSANTLFREVYVLAHTQHLKNKDIYEGGSKMVVVLDASDLRSDQHELETWRLYKLQFGFINAFLDIFVTKNKKAMDPRVVDYYGEDEPIEIGPDENMHDTIIETIAKLSVKRKYLLGIGIISSKKVGINHKQYGVTSTGVMKFAEITMQELGTDIHNHPFSVKFTGGPNGDVAGNAMRIMIERCPLAEIKLILDGTAALFDPEGADRNELGRLLLQRDLDAFDPEQLHPGGFILYRSRRSTKGLRELYLKATRTTTGVKEKWVSLDEFSREYNNLIFTVTTDLFIPAGGRPETIDEDNAERFFLDDGTPAAKVIIEGANSFLTPEARIILQKRGVIIMRDSSANKCGVISSSYEIIANLLLTEKEFLFHKERYVVDVLEMLEKRAGDEARLILHRKQKHSGNLLYTEISDAISMEINTLYARLFKFFQDRPDLCQQPLFRQAVFSHLPQLLCETSTYRRRIKYLPPKYLYAILASEIASSLVYTGDQETDFAEMIRWHLLRSFKKSPSALRRGVTLKQEKHTLT